MKAKQALGIVLMVGTMVAVPLAFGAGEGEQAGTEEVMLQAWINDFNPESRALMVDELIPQFEAANPGVTLEMQFIGWGNHSEKYLTAWAGGEVPDIFEPALEQAAEMIAKGQTIALDKYVSAWGEIDDFYEAGYEPYMKDGRYYTVPFRLDIRNVYYRKDIFREAGLDPEQPPDTWDDLARIAKALTVRDGNKVDREGFNVEIGNFGGQEFVEFVWQNGGELLSPDNEPLLDSPEVLEALTFLTELYQAIRPEGTAQLPQSPIPYFATGQRAMEYGGLWTFVSVLKHAPEHVDDVGVALPLLRKQRVNNVFGGGFAISTAAQHPDAAWRWIEYFVSADVQARYNELIGAMPSRRAAVEYEFFQHPILQQVLESAQYGKIYLIIPAWWEMLSVLGDQLELSYNGRKTPAAALADAQAGWQAILAREAP